MPSLKDYLNQLKLTVVGTKTSDLDNQLDIASKEISAIRSQNSRASYIELVKNLISKTDFKMPQTYGSLSGGGMTPGMMGQGARLQRYTMYESITTYIPYCNRALQVLVDNIISPDDITKTSLEVKPKSKLSEDSLLEADTKTVEELIEKIKLDKYLPHIVKNTLHYGDYFCELVDDKTALTSKGAMLAESQFLHLPDEVKDTEIIKVKLEKSNLEIEMDYRAYNEGTDDSNKGIMKVENLHLLFYDPKRVVKLQSNMYPVCFGYLVFPATTINPQMMMQDMVINNICATILGSLDKKIPELNIKNIDEKDLKETLRLMITETDPSKMMNIRYVPPDKMVHFNIPTRKFFPYGESIFDCVVFPAKCLIALETALAMHRLNRSIERRKISMEIGLPRDSAKAIERMKEEINKRKIALDSFGSLDSIPSMISSMETLFLPMKDGRELVTVGTWNDAGSDIRGKTDELKLLRDTIVAGTNVPPSYVGVDENISNKNALTSESFMFARTIVADQKTISEQVQELIQKVFKIIDPEKATTIMDDVLVAFPVPRTLQDENEAKQIGDAVNIIQQLEAVGVPREWSKKRYLPNIPWDEVDKYEIETKIETKLKIPSPSEIASMSGGLGAYGMGNDLGGIGGDMGLGGSVGMPPIGGGNPEENI